MNKYDDTDYLIEREESIEYEEKTADEMFEELGLVEEVENTIYTILGDEEKSIIFNKDKKEIEINNIRYLDLRLLKAINKKCKELGWLDE